MSFKNFRLTTASTMSIICVSQEGCGDNLAPWPGTDSTSAAHSTTEDLPTSGATDSTTGESVCEQSYPLPVEVFELADDEPGPETIFPGRDCDILDLVGTDANQLDPTLDIFTVFVYQPSVPMTMGAWPPFKLPYVVFSPGADQFSAQDVPPFPSLYQEMIEAYTSVGFVVFAIQPTTVDNRGAFWSVGRRARAMACTTLWAFSNWNEKDNDRLNCDFIASGHSRGGEAAYFFAQNIVGPLIDLGFEDKILRGIIAIAPRSKPEFDDPDTDVFTSPVPGHETVPYLIIHGANDEDIKSDPTRSFEIYGREEEPTELPKHDKVLLWAHDVLHNEWGGKVTSPAFDDGKADSIEALYIPAFLRWQILETGDPADRQLFTDLVHYDRSAITWDASIDIISFWNSSEPEFGDLEETPVIFADLTLGLHDDNNARLQIDTMRRSSFASCVSSVSPSSSGEAVNIGFLDPTQVCMGSPRNLIAPVPSGVNEDAHQATSAMRVRWGGTESGGQVAWGLDAGDVSDYSFLSFRAGQIRHLSPDSMTTLRVGLVTLTNGNDKDSFSVDVKIYTQDDEPSGNLSNSPIFATDFMRTIRIPLSDFCALGADVSQVLEIVISFPEEDESRSMLLDSVEFTKHADSMDLGICL